MTKPTYEVTLQPIGRRIEVPAGTNLLDAARLAGVELVAICGGEGVCGSCRVHPVSGQLSPRTLTEEAELSDDDLAAGDRLACQAEVLSDVRVGIPPESFTTPQRLQLEGQEIPPALDPVVIPLEVEVLPPSLGDLRSDLTRLRASLAGLGHADLHFGLEVAADLPEKLRANNWRVRLAIRGDEVVAILPPPIADDCSQITNHCSLITDHCSLYGLAVDIGTTKLAAYLVNLESGETAAKTGAMNPQIAYGEDLISRIAYANDHPDGAQMLQGKLVETLNHLMDELCAEAKVSRAQVVEAVIVGNTAMHHLFVGLPVKQLGEAPYVAAVGEAMEFPASQVGLRLAVGAYVYLPPNLAGYVGADHVSMLLGAGLFGSGDFAKHPGRVSRSFTAEAVTTSVHKTIVALDIGTNTEISLFHAGKHYSCSCASGPAFEGAHIADGMRAAPGAIERVRIKGGEVKVHTIGGGAPVGICGSGILDVVAELLGAGLLDKRGVLKGNHPNLRVANNGIEFILTPAERSGIGGEIKITRQDVNEIQLAKGAIRAGIEILLKEAGIEDQDIELFVVAGAFGTYLDLQSAIRIGMFPDLPRPRFKQVGNAAGGGARKLLVSKEQRRLADEIAREVNYVELAVHPDFMKVYIKALAFG
ncbi:MAG: ASKHA domain-containing protein [Anaerolineales bacterium]|nr:ASKHA domain-containing protein [Anaerolineales bacterium]